MLKTKLLVPLFFCFITLLALCVPRGCCALWYTDYESDVNMIMQNRVAITKNYVSFTFKKGTNIITYVFYKGENRFYRQIVTSHDAAIFKFGGVEVYDYDNDKIAATVAYVKTGLSWYVYGYVLNLNTGTRTTRGVTPSAEDVEVSKPVKGPDGFMYAFYWHKYSANKYLYIFKFTETQSSVPASLQIDLNAATVWSHCFVQPNQNVVYGLCRHNSGYWSLFRHNVSANSLSLAMISPRVTDAESLFRTYFAHEWNRSVLTLYQASVRYLGNYYFEFRFHTLNFTANTWNTWFIYGIDKLEETWDEEVCALYGWQIVAANYIDIYGVNSKNQIWRVKFSVADKWTNPTVTSVTKAKLAENTISTGLCTLAIRFLNIYKIEVYSTNWGYETQNLAAVYEALRFNAVLLEPNSTKVKYGEVYLVKVKFLGNDMPLAGWKVNLEASEPGDVKGFYNFITDEKGIVSFYYGFHQWGVYRFLFRLIDLDGFNVWNFTVFFSTGYGDIPVTPQKPEYQVPAIVNVIIPLAFLFTPSLVLAHIVGKTGLLIGLIIGSICLWIAGYLPIWAIFLIALGLIAYIFLARDRGGL